MTIQSTLGFIFTPDFQKVLLIRKNKPEHHKGKLNGLGGKNEPGETAIECIVREIQEEASVLIPAEQWKLVGTMNWEVWHVTVYTAIYEGELSDVYSPDSEPVNWYEVNHLPDSIIKNLNWLVPLCLDVLENNQKVNVQIRYE